MHAVTENLDNQALIITTTVTVAANTGTDRPSCLIIMHQSYCFGCLYHQVTYRASPVIQKKEGVLPVETCQHELAFPKI